MHRNIQFYSLADLRNYWNTDRVLQLLKETLNELTTNDTLELYEASKMIPYLKDEIKRQINYEETLKLCKKKAFQGLGHIDNSNIADRFREIKTRKYRWNFFELIEKKKEYKNLSEKGFDNLKKISNFDLSYILKCKNLMKTWGKPIYLYLKQNPDIIPTLLSKYTNPDFKNNDWYLPQEVDNPASWEELITIYINYQKANPNFLEQIIETPNIDNFKISDETRYLAQKKAKQILDAEIKNVVPITTKTKVSFSDKEQWVTVKNSQSETKIIISKKWITNNLDYPTLFNNFIYLFGLTDIFARSSLVSLKSQETELEPLFRNWTSRSFRNNWSFDENLANQRLLISAYYQLLKQHGVLIEQMCEWFFNTYIPDEFGISGFKFNAPNSQSSYLEKCRIIFSEIDNVLKQYNLYSTKGYIDQDFLNFKSTPLDISNVKSLIPNKFVYFSKTEGRAIATLLFSTQAFTSICVKYQSKNFFDAVTHNKVFIQDVEEFDRNDLRYLIQFKIVNVKDDILQLNKKCVAVLRSIYLHGEYEPYWSKDVTTILDYLKEKNIIRFGQTLLAEPEMDFYYYICNSRKFTNGLDLRNKYIHGNSNLSEKENELNFYTILLVLIILIIRINDELCWQDDMQESVNRN